MGLGLGLGVSHGLTQGATKQAMGGQGSSVVECCVVEPGGFGSAETNTPANAATVNIIAKSFIVVVL